MKKLVIVINGRGGVGKDTLCDLAATRYAVTNLSSITPIKELAARCGWAGEKTDKARRFLSDLKRLLIAYNDYPTTWAAAQYRTFLAGDDQILFMHIREPEEIDKFVRATHGQAKTLLIRGGRRDAQRASAYGNPSDDGVEDYAYDYYYVNDAPLDQVREEFLAFLDRVYEKDSAVLTE